MRHHRSIADSFCPGDRPACRSISHWREDLSPVVGTSCRSWPPSRAASVRRSRSRASGTSFLRGTLDVGYRPVQPVPYSHKLHVGELGLDCRYCHASVEISAVANVPPTQHLHELPCAREEGQRGARTDSGQRRRAAGRCAGFASTSFPTTPISPTTRTWRQESAVSPATAASTRWKRSPR